MYEFLVDNKPVAIALIIIGVVLLIFLLVKFLQRVGLEKVREVAYKGFVEAEHEFLQGENTEKFEYVVNLVKSAVPAPFNLFITEKLLRKVIQLWFDLCKDLLDDGRINNSGKKEEEE